MSEDSSAVPTVLLDEHRRLGAQLVPFAGFLMPIRYGSIFEEHQTVRERAGLFDLSHMAQLEFEGEGALEFLESVSTNILSNLKVGKARYSIITQADGGAIDDIIVYHFADRVMLVANAANTLSVINYLQERLPKGLHLHHASDRGLIALQGPLAAQILQPLVDVDLTTLGNYSGTAARLGATPILLARTGYTGEDGFELFIPGDRAPEIFHTLLEAGRTFNILPAGLAARDMLRLEAGMPLFGNELSTTISPIEAGQGWAVRFDKGEFIGRSALYAQHTAPKRSIVGLKLRDRIPMRAGYIVSSGGFQVGEIRSATIAPSLERASIATALVDTPHNEIGHTLDVTIRGTLYPADIVRLPFYRRARVAVISNSHP